MKKFINIASPDDENPTPQIPSTSLSDASSLFEIAFRNRWLIFGCIVIALVIGFVYINYATPIFNSTSTVYVEQKGPKIVDENAGVMTQSKNYLYTQAELFKSTPVLSYAIKSPGIKEMAMFELMKGPLVDFLKGSLDISVGKKDDIIRVSFNSPYPDEAAQLVNAVVDSYITYHSTRKRGTTAEVLKILQTEKNKRESELTQKLEEMSKFRQANVIDISDDSDTSSRLNQLQLQLTDLYRYATDKHPVVIATKDKIDQLKKQNELNAQYALLKNDYDENRNRVIILEDRIKELSTTEETGALNISIVEVAVPAIKPVKPQKAKVLAMALVLGLMLGGGLALLRDSRDQKLYSSEEISNALGIPVVALVPSMPKNETLTERGQKVHLKSDSPGAEAYRTIRTSIFFGIKGDKAQTILITSPTPNDGKTTLASNLAIAMAQADQKTLILDADFRKSMQHNIFQKPNKDGLSEVLKKEISLDRAIQSAGINNLDLLVAGSKIDNPAEMLNSAEFTCILKDLSVKYDRIIMDSPPVIPVTDSQILAAMCDVTLLVLRADKSTRMNCLHARDNLINVDASLFGAVINDVSVKSRGYGYGYGYGYGERSSAVTEHKLGSIPDDKKKLRIKRA